MYSRLLRNVHLRNVHLPPGVCVVCVCERERARESEREGGREGGREGEWEREEGRGVGGGGGYLALEEGRGGDQNQKRGHQKSPQTPAPEAKRHTLATH
jgi:hypothetical protein